MKRAPGSGNCRCKGPVVAMDLSTELKVSPLAQSTGGWVVVWLDLCFGKMRAEKQAWPRAPGSPGDKNWTSVLLMRWCSFLLGVLSAEHQG